MSDVYVITQALGSEAPGVEDGDWVMVKILDGTFMIELERDFDDYTGLGGWGGWPNTSYTYTIQQPRLSQPGVAYTIHTQLDQDKVLELVKPVDKKVAKLAEVLFDEEDEWDDEDPSKGTFSDLSRRERENYYLRAERYLQSAGVLSG